MEVSYHPAVVYWASSPDARVRLHATKILARESPALATHRDENLEIPWTVASRIYYRRLVFGHEEMEALVRMQEEVLLGDAAVDVALEHLESFIRLFVPELKWLIGYRCAESRVWILPIGAKETKEAPACVKSWIFGIRNEGWSPNEIPAEVWDFFMER